MFFNASTVSIVDFDMFELSPNLVLFDFDNIAPNSCFQALRQSPRHSTQSPRVYGKFPRHSNSFPAHRSGSPVNNLSFLPLAQLNWVPFSDISKKDFDILVENPFPNSSSKRKQTEEHATNNKFYKQGTQSDKSQGRISNKKNIKPEKI